MEFFDDLSVALSQSGGQLSMQQVVDLLPNNQKHRVMTHLNAARNSGVCSYAVRVVNGKGVVTITPPKSVVSSSPQIVGGGD